MKEIVFLFCAVCVTSAFASSREWSYDGKHGPPAWKDTYPKCSGDRNSPVHIKTSDLVFKPKLGKILFHGYGDAPDAMKVKNNGHTAVFELTGHITIKGGGLEGTYRARQFHFHWGSTNEKGSEHVIDHIRYPMEMHIVHYSTEYPGLAAALDDPDGVAVLAFFFELAEKDNPALKPLVDAVQHVLKKDSEATLKQPFPIKNILPFSTDVFFRYEGSLTTPPCSEAVVWTLFRNTIPISENQLEAFRELHASSKNKDLHLEDNYRPLQKLNSRRISVNRAKGNFIKRK